MKNILVTGGAGYVGSVLVEKLLRLDYFVRIIDLFIYDEKSLDHLKNSNNLEIVKGDIRDEVTINRVTKNIDTIIHLASISNDPTAELNENLTKSVNYDAYVPLLKYSKLNGVQRFINASSSSVFGMRDEENITEELEPMPITTYSKYKALSEKLVNAASSDSFITVNIRPATICGYSPRQRFDLTVNVLTKDAVTKRLITVNGGEQMRPNVTMDDVTDLYIYMINADSKLINGETFNFGFENFKVIEIAEIIKQTLPFDVKIEIKPVIDQRNYHISSEKIVKKLGVTPNYGIVDMVKTLNQKFTEGKFENPEDEKYYNIKKMKVTHFG